MVEGDAPEVYEEYPVWICAVAELMQLGIYALGALILLEIAPWAAGVFLVYCLALEVRLMLLSCVDCCYYGKRCFSGKGLIVAKLFSRRDPEQFARTKITFKDIIPDFAVGLVPLVTGLGLLVVRGPSWYMGGLVLLLSALAFPVTGWVRSTLACPHCKQREIGCPAQELFGGEDGDGQAD